MAPPLVVSGAALGRDPSPCGQRAAWVPKTASARRPHATPPPPPPNRAHRSTPACSSFTCSLQVYLGYVRTVNGVSKCYYRASGLDQTSNVFDRLCVRSTFAVREATVVAPACACMSARAGACCCAEADSLLLLLPITQLLECLLKAVCAPHPSAAVCRLALRASTAKFGHSWRSTGHQSSRGPALCHAAQSVSEGSNRVCCGLRE